MSEEELQEQIIQQIEVLVEELGGTMCHLTKCTYTGRQSKILQIEYNVEGDQYSNSKTFISLQGIILLFRRLVFNYQNSCEFSAINTSLLLFIHYEHFRDKS